MSININEYSMFRAVSPTEIGTPVSNGSSSPESSSPSPVEVITNIQVASKRISRPMNPPKNIEDELTPIEGDMDITYKLVVEQSAWDSIEQAIAFTKTHDKALLEEYRNSDNHEAKDAIGKKLAKNRNSRIGLIASKRIAFEARIRKEERAKAAALKEAPQFHPEPPTTQIITNKVIL